MGAVEQHGDAMACGERYAGGAPAMYPGDAAAAGVLASGAAAAAATVARRDKSLSALSKDLILRYGHDGAVIDLDEVQARFPNWKKRRLYDVMCVCQCLHVVERTSKSQFVWKGPAYVQVRGG